MQPATHRPVPEQTEKFGQVLQFPGRNGAGRAGAIPVAAAPVHGLDAQTAAADDFARYEQDQDEPVDYRQRMLMNVIALAIVTLLVGAGVWIADTIAGLERDQDCIMQGRANCAPIETPASTRR